MSSKIYVGGLSYQTTEKTLRKTCEKYGGVIEARIICDRETKNSRGFGFVTFLSNDAANSAIMALDGKDLEGRRLKVNEDRERRYNRGGEADYVFGDDDYEAFRRLCDNKWSVKNRLVDEGLQIN